jgi:hypothetical protein
LGDSRVISDLNETKASLSVTILRVADSSARKMELKYMRRKKKADESIRWEGRAMQVLFFSWMDESNVYVL